MRHPTPPRISVTPTDAQARGTYEPGLSGAAKPERNPMPTVTLLDEIDELERLLPGARAPLSTSSQPGQWLRVADDDEDEEDDLFGDDDLGFDDIDEDTEDDDDELDGEDDLDEDLDEDEDA